MTHKRQKQLLINFLKEEGLLITFFVNMILFGKTSSFAALVARNSKKLRYNTAEWLMHWAFDWDATSEGWLYWSDKEDKWYRYTRINVLKGLTYPTPSTGYKSFSSLHTEFLNFLRKKGIHSKYQFNVAEYNLSFKNTAFDPQTTPPQFWVSRAFSWSDTPERYNRWHVVAQDWRAYLIGSTDVYTETKARRARRKGVINA